MDMSEQLVYVIRLNNVDIIFLRSVWYWMQQYCTRLYVTVLGCAGIVKVLKNV